MFRKNKKSIIFIIISIYFIGMMISLSGDLVLQIQTVRHQNQIEKIKNAQTLEFSIKEWNSFSDNKEIKFQNNYYDVISFQEIDSKIIVKVIKDQFESEFRVCFSKIFNKSKFPCSEKKKSNSISKHLISENKSVYDSTISQVLKLKSCNEIFMLKTSTFLNFQEKPPC